MRLTRAIDFLHLRSFAFQPGVLGAPAVLAMAASEKGLFQLFHGHYVCSGAAGNRFMQISIALTVDGIATNIEYESSVAVTAGQTAHFIVARGNAPIFDYLVGTTRFIHFYVSDSIILDGLTFTARGILAGDDIQVAQLITEAYGL